MRQATAKKIRQGIKRDNVKQIHQFSALFSEKLNGMPLRKRFKFAWSVIRANVD